MNLISHLGLAICLFAQLNTSLFASVDEPTTIVASTASSNEKSDTDQSLSEADGQMSVEQAIAKFELRTQNRKNDYLSLTVLGQLYLRQAKENDDLPCYAKAEDTFRSALKIKPEYVSAKTWLAVTLQARHGFTEALELATTVASTNERDTLALATKGDCQLHLGQYEEAEKTYALLAERAQSPAVIARLAHLSELNGLPDQALNQIEEALALSRESGAEGEDLAWYEMRLGHLLMGQGKLENSEAHFRKALELSKNYSAAQLGLAEVCALQGHLDEAESIYTTAVDQHGEPPAMAGLGDVLAKQGDSAGAEKWYVKSDAVMTEEAATAAAAHYREVAMFLANHDRDAKRALELAELDLKQRQDVHAWDCLAWTLYRNQKYDQALEAMEKATRLKTRDANLYFHKGMIHLAMGDKQKARESLTTVMEINPRFSVLFSDVAASELKKLEQ